MSECAIPGIDTFVLEPPGLGVALRVSIALPPHRALAGKPPGKIALAYVTDGDLLFGTAAEACRLAHMVGEIAPSAVVGIGYAQEKGDYIFVNRRRGLDFYRGPRRTIQLPGFGSMELGGADDFLTTLLEQVFPEVERRVPGGDPAQRFLLGASAGGHFAAYALMKSPTTFAGCALMSAYLRDFALPPGGEDLVSAMEAMPEQAFSRGLRVYLSAGALEFEPLIISDAERMRSVLARRGVTAECVIFPGETHTSVSSAALSRALRFLLPPTAPADDLQAVVRGAR